MDLTVRLHNLSETLRTLFDLPLVRTAARGTDSLLRPQPLPLRQRQYEQVHEAIMAVLTEAGSAMRLRDIRFRVGERLGHPVDQERFKSYVNEQTKLANPRLERRGYGRYQIRRR